ncbi:polysaccharide deacetylase family protein [Chungangia koreensis]|uniref:Polysaccharide deacetylase family protein n=1 Tax=Chungangia koreensis TaxID=752657 RepID=A0ABV8X1Z3_9LACT
MRKYFASNLLFTLIFLVVIVPLSYLLLHYVFSSITGPVAASEPLSQAGIAQNSTNRDFSEAKDYAERVTVLMYHQIIPEKKLMEHHFTEANELIDSIVTLEQFTEQMDYLTNQDYTVLSLKEFEEFMIKHKKVPEKSVLITFDDGYKNVFEFAYPVLKERGFHAVHFLITGLITERTHPFTASKLQYASIEELIESSDVFDYGNHTHSFHRKTEEGSAFLTTLGEEIVKEDLEKAIEWLGHSELFAAPYGEYSPATLDILRDLGMKMAFTVSPGYAEPSNHILEIPRYGVYPFYTMEDFKYILEQSLKD